jgi:sugar phosphate isomerase/epimerase
MVLIGFPIWLGDKDKFASKVSEAHDAGFDYIELSFDYPWPLPDEETPRRIAKYAWNAGLEVAIHGSWRDVRLASPVNEVREASLGYVSKTFQIAQKLEPKYVVLHISTDQAVNEVKELEPLVSEAAAQSARELAELASKLGMMLLFENVPSSFCSSVEHVKKLVSSVSEVGVCLDIGHAWLQTLKSNEERKMKTEEVVDKWVERLRNRIRAVHVHDCLVKEGRIQEHVVPSLDSPSIKSLSRFKERNLSLYFVVLEVFRRPDGKEASPKDLAKLVTHLKRVL